MSERRSDSAAAARTGGRLGRDATIDRDRGVFMISVAAELAEMHPQTLRMYEARGLITPKRSPKNTRLYSHEDVERLRRIQQMTAEEGLNLAGVETVLELEERLEEMRAEVARMRERAAEMEQRMADEIEQRAALAAAPRSSPTAPTSRSSAAGQPVRVPVRRSRLRPVELTRRARNRLTSGEAPQRDHAVLAVEGVVVVCLQVAAADPLVAPLAAREVGGSVERDLVAVDDERHVDRPERGAAVVTDPERSGGGLVTKSSLTTIRILPCPNGLPETVPRSISAPPVVLRTFLVAPVRSTRWRSFFGLRRRLDGAGARTGASRPVATISARMRLASRLIR